MSNRIFQPRNAPFDFFAQDGVQNALMRAEQGATTTGTGIVTLGTIPLVEAAFDSNGKCFFSKFFGNFNNGAGTKRLIVNFDSTLVFDHTTAVIGNSNYVVEIFAMRRVTSFVQLQITLEHALFTGTSSTVTKLQRADVLGSIDFNISHTLNLQGQVSNGGDNISLSCWYASML